MRRNSPRLMGENPFPQPNRGEPFDMKAIAAGQLWELEAWEASIAMDLANAGTIKAVWVGPVTQVIMSCLGPDS